MRRLPPGLRDGVARAGSATLRAYGMATASSRPWPDFLLVGAKRGGSTAFWSGLVEHPDVVPLFPPASRLLPLKRSHTKGVHYFDTAAHRSPRWYRSHFPSARARRRASPGRRTVTGEGSPYYLMHPQAPARAAALLGPVTVLAVLRDPVERTWSHWREQTRNGVETLSFRDAVEAEEDRTRGEEERLAADPGAVSAAHEHQAYVAQSEYGRGLARWRSAVGPENVHVYVSEEYWAAPQAVYDDVSRLLGVREVPLGAGRLANAAPRPSPMDPDVREGLVRRFAPTVDAVEEVLGRRLPWSRP